MIRSFIEVADDDHFPIQNIPFGVFSTPLVGRHIGTAIGGFVLDLTVLQQHGLLPGSSFQSDSLDPFLAGGCDEWRRVRACIQELLDERTPTLRDNHQLRQRVLIPIADATLHLPVTIGDYSDFYSSKQHAMNVGSLFRDPSNPLLPNWVHMPVAYHGRASSVVVSGTPIRRPCGQTKPPDAPLPHFGPSRMLDIELEIGVIIGRGNELGEPIPVDQARQHAFGMVLLNDWSARDIQRWEYEPLGPFLGKNFATSISPWIVTFDALEEFRVAGPQQDPLPLPYLRDAEPCAYDIQLAVSLTTPENREPIRITQCNARELYWSIAQQIAHHTVNGCNLRRGDLLGSGTISGSTPDAYGSLLELTWKGTKPITWPNGNTRTFLHDGDTVSITGYSRGKGYTIGFGEVIGTVVGARG
jgi:fumarylacetoacetase